MFRVTPKNPDDITKFRDALAPASPSGGRTVVDPAIDEVHNRQEDTNKILAVTRVVKISMALLAGVLGVASILLIANTVRLSIHSRRREIEVMKLVGATNWFVRGPFMVEGLLCGLVGAFAAVVLLLLGREIALPAILGHIDTTSSNDVRALGFTLTALILMLVGLVVGAVGSTFTLRRYLKV
jgi:cell division transport system permease protein